MSNLPSQKEILEILDYNPETGDFTWKHRSDQRDGWNTRYAGKIAGSPTGDGYYAISIDDIKHLAHRLAWSFVNGDFGSKLIDHIDRNKRNNKISNLRLCTLSQNQYNRGLAKNNKSGYPGVILDKRSGKWRAQIIVEKRAKYLGVFRTPEAAHSAYMAEKVKILGKFSLSGLSS